MKTMSWGVKIAILYGGFVVLILSMVFRTMTYKVDLVRPDYYQEELKFQDNIDATANTSSAELKFDIQAKAQTVSMVYPESWKGKAVTGKVVFYRPSDSDLDQKFTAAPAENGIQVFSSSKFKRGAYKMICDFTLEGKPYHYEESLFMN